MEKKDIYDKKNWYVPLALAIVEHGLDEVIGSPDILLSIFNDHFGWELENFYNINKILSNEQYRALIDAYSDGIDDLRDNVLVPAATGPCVHVNHSYGLRLSNPQKELLGLTKTILADGLQTQAEGCGKHSECPSVLFGVVAPDIYNKHYPWATYTVCSDDYSNVDSELQRHGAERIRAGSVITTLGAPPEKIVAICGIPVDILRAELQRREEASLVSEALDAVLGISENDMFYVNIHHVLPTEELGHGKTGYPEYNTATAIGEKLAEIEGGNFEPIEVCNQKPVNPYRIQDKVLANKSGEAENFYYVLNGHHRLEAARRLGMKQVPVTLTTAEGTINESSSPVDERLLRKLDIMPNEIGVKIWEDASFDVTMEFGYMHNGHFVVLATKADVPVFRARMEVHAPEETIPYGNIRITKWEGPGPCNNAWQVIDSYAQRGFGPILYELALEYGSTFGDGLMADREVVSKYAHAVWKKYQGRGDVHSLQLDIDKETAEERTLDQLTPEDPRDDCKMDSVLDRGKNRWEGSALSKSYFKESSPLTDFLDAAERIFISPQ